MDGTLSFLNYNVIETYYKCNPSLELEDEEVSPRFDIKVHYKDKKREKALILFQIELGDIELKDNTFYLKALVMGNFSLEIKETKEETTEAERKEFIDHMYQKNTISILYPYLRSLVSDLSSKGSESPIILPPMNIISMVEKKDVLEEIYGSSSNEELEE